MLPARQSRILSLPFTLMMLALASACAASEAALDVDAVGEAAGTVASAGSDGVVRIGWSRDDVPVTVDGTLLPPAAGLGGVQGPAGRDRAGHGRYRRIRR
jgi:hypothetical protein